MASSMNNPLLPSALLSPGLALRKPAEGWRLETRGRPILRDVVHRSQVYAGCACYGTAPQDEAERESRFRCGPAMTAEHAATSKRQRQITTADSSAPCRFPPAPRSVHRRPG